ncbi:hypothetical protein BN1012_Phect1771 [Candidatus Phaeomarinobacter ectocarpi]|jgi:hypothetical protein|uniref:Uncharacterized protein n=1 Tax=Candidatus Phaeomarinibacter ectocarpi TaxID=1458461 RepID=X5MM16_9HYPH|nr:hypothetical protein [Candidatus Phaeomarinobacter ectocarpi]CDO59985.1 hypothetical protein BN1012_Phect1771 [Candidatus Phaeomarinobacter ectocarpi]
MAIFKRALVLAGLLAASAAITVPAAAAPLCNTAGLKSSSSSNARQLVVVNTPTNRSTDLYWIDQQGKRKFYKTIAAGARFVQMTYQGHVWVLENNLGYCDAIFVVDSNLDVVVR